MGSTHLSTEYLKSFHGCMNSANRLTILAAEKPSDNFASIDEQHDKNPHSVKNKNKQTEQFNAELKAYVLYRAEVLYVLEKMREEEKQREELLEEDRKYHQKNEPIVTAKPLPRYEKTFSREKDEERITRIKHEIAMFIKELDKKIAALDKYIMEKKERMEKARELFFADYFKKTKAALLIHFGMSDSTIPITFGPHTSPMSVDTLTKHICDSGMRIYDDARAERRLPPPDTLIKSVHALVPFIAGEIKEKDPARAHDATVIATTMTESIVPAISPVIKRLDSEIKITLAEDATLQLAQDGLRAHKQVRQSINESSAESADDLERMLSEAQNLVDGVDSTLNIQMQERKDTYFAAARQQMDRDESPAPVADLDQTATVSKEESPPQNAEAPEQTSTFRLNP